MSHSHPLDSSVNQQSSPAEDLVVVETRFPGDISAKEANIGPKSTSAGQKIKLLSSGNVPEQQSDLHDSESATRRVGASSTSQLEDLSSKQIPMLDNVKELEVVSPEWNAAEKTWNYGIALIDSNDDMHLKTTHRYSHFSMLREMLKNKFPGYILPVLPKKNVKLALPRLGVQMSSENEALLFRKRLLERFLNECLGDRKICESLLFREFVHLSYDEWEEKRKHDHLKSTEKMKRFFSSMFSKKSPDTSDFVLSKVENRVKEEAHKISTLRSSIAGVQKNQKEMSHQFSGIAKELSSEDVEISTASQVISDSTSQLVEDEQTEVLDMLDYYILMFGEVRKVAHKLRQWHFHQLYASSQVDKKKANIANCRKKLSQESNENRKEKLRRKIEKMEGELTSLVSSAQESRTFFEEAEARFNDSFGLFVEKKQEEVRRLIHRFFIFLRDTSEKQALMYEELLQGE